MYQQQKVFASKSEQTSNCQRKPISIINTTIKKQTAYYQAVRGMRSQTKQLNIHFKTLNKKHLRKSMLANQISKHNKPTVENYRKMKPNFQSTKYLFNGLDSTTKQKFKLYYQSTEMTKDILTSDRMFFMNKIIMLKFMKKLETCIDEPNTCWKAQYFHKRKQQPIIQDLPDLLPGEGIVAQNSDTPNNIEMRELLKQQGRDGDSNILQMRSPTQGIAMKEQVGARHIVKHTDCNQHINHIQPINNRQQPKFPIGLIYSQYAMMGHNHSFYNDFGYQINHRLKDSEVKGLQLHDNNNDNNQDQKQY